MTPLEQLKRDNARRKLLGALDRKAIARLSERLNPDYSTRPELEREILAVWPEQKVAQEILDLLIKAA